MVKAMGSAQTNSQSARAPSAPEISAMPKMPVMRRHGGNQVSIGQYNERLVLSLLRSSGGMTKAELARHTHLSAQTITVIVNRLEAEGLVIAGRKQRGRVGQPSTPYTLNPTGLMTIGLKIGRRQLDYLAMAFDGAVLARQTFRFEHPFPHIIMETIKKTLPDFLDSLPPHWRQKLMGCGLAMPNALSGWETALGVEEGSLAGWDEVDVCAEISQITGCPVQVMNDVTAACLAELNFGIGRQYRDFLYIYVGSLVGGGLVLDSQLQTGQRGNVAALAPMPISVAGGNQPPLLLDRASLIHLERLFVAAELDHQTTCRDQIFTGPYKALYDKWLNEAADALAFSIVAAASFLDLDAVILDAAIAPENLSDLFTKVHEALADYSTVGLHLPEILQGTQGYDARVLGDAFLPISDHYAADTSRLVKDL